MSIVLIAPDRDLCGLVQALERRAPETAVFQWPDVGTTAAITFAVCWNPPPGALARLPALKAISSLGAGIDGLLSDPELPPDLPLGRLVGPRLAHDMAAWTLGHINRFWYRSPHFETEQAAKRWSPWSPDRLPAVGLLGTGAMTRPLINSMKSLGFEIHGWSRSGRRIASVNTHTGPSGLHALAQAVDVMVCLLPLTPQTRDLLNQDLFSSMRPGSLLINAGRGEHLVEVDLLAALEKRQPSHAVLDVFRQEPLPVDHPFWGHPKIRVSPHCAAISQDDDTAELILESYRRVLDGQPPLGWVDRKLAY